MNQNSGFKLIAILLLIISPLISLYTFGRSNDQIKGYNLTKPDKKINLPAILNEVSGVTRIDENTVACVQDENGIIFIYDLVNNQIKNQYKFHIDGDYEGIARVGQTIYILRSEGTLFEISDYTKSDFILKSYVTGIPANNNEGLCYDEANSRLLIACKSTAGKGPEYKDKRMIYGFELKTKKLDAQPVFSFDLTDIRKFVTDNKIDVDTREKKNGKAGKTNVPIIRFRTSAIDIHPISKKLYLLSAADHLLFIFDQFGNAEHIEQLDPIVFNKAEGITFFKNGDMLITNEAQDKKPTLLHFRYAGK